MQFRIKLSLLIFFLLFGLIGIAARWGNAGGFFNVNVTPGQYISISSMAKCTYSDCSDCFYNHPLYIDFSGSVSGLYRSGKYSGTGDCKTRMLKGGVLGATYNAGPGYTDVIYMVGASAMYGPIGRLTVAEDQIPDECAEAGDPVSVMDGTFNLESADLSSGNSSGVSLIRTYKSRGRNVYFEDDTLDYKNLFFPFSEGGWTHNYVKSIIMSEYDGNIYYKIRDGNEIRDVAFVKESGSDSIVFADNYKVHRGLVAVDADHWEYTKSDGTVEFYSRSEIFLQIALIDSIEQFGEVNLRFEYDEGDTLDYVTDKWGDSLKFYYDIYNSIPLLHRVEISGKDEWMEYKYVEFYSLYGYYLDSTHYFHRLSQIVKHTDGDSLIVLDRYYYNRNLIPGVDSGVDVKSDIVTHVFPQGAYDEDNDTSVAAYNNHRLSGYRVNNWYGKYGEEGVYYQEIATGDTILEKTYIERFYSGYHRVDSIYVYHWEDLRELGAHDPNDTEFTPTPTGYDYAEIIRYNSVGTRSSVTIAGKTTTYLSYDSDYNPNRN